MRLRVPLPLLLAFVSPAVLPAQFQAPTPDELKMTSDPAAPGAAAVYLYREDNTDESRHIETIYVRAKVLSETGKSLATVKIPYDRAYFDVKAIEGRTIHPDGTIVPLNVKPAELLETKSKDSRQVVKVFNLPDVTVGSILEYRMRFDYGEDYLLPPYWEVQADYMTRQLHMEYFAGLGSLLYSFHLPEGASVVHEFNHYSLDMKNVPAAPDEDWRPPLNTFSWNVKFYYSQYKDGAEFWNAAKKSWLEAVNDFAKPNKGLKAQAEQLTAATDNDRQKALKLYNAVMKLENTDFTRYRTHRELKKEKLKLINTAEDVWTGGRGNSRQIALLYLALLRAAGLTAYPMQVVSRDRALFDPTFLSLGQFDDYVIIVTLGGKEVYLDPGEKMCGFGMLHWSHAPARGLRQTAQGTDIVTTPVPNYKANLTTRTADLYLTADGAVAGTVRIVMDGSPALHWRQITAENDEAEVKKQFNESLNSALPEGMHAEFDHFLSLDDFNSLLVAVVKVTGTPGAGTSRRMFLPASLFESRGHQPFVTEDKRITPIDVKYPEAVVDEVVYHLPAGYALEGAQEPVSVTWPNHAYMTVKTAVSGQDLKVVRNAAYNFVLLNAAEYPGIHDYYRKVSAADQQQLVLRAEAAKGQ